MSERNADEIGALWEKQGRRGLYMTGTIGGQRVVLFKNDRKRSDKQPDWRVLKSQPRDGASQSGGDDDFRVDE